MRKGILATVAVLFAGFAAATVLACGDANGHEHLWDSAWSSDEYSHWHACLVDGCGAVNDMFAHTAPDADGKCEVCKRQLGTTPDIPDVPDTGDDAFSSVALSQSGVLSWNKIRGASKYVISVTYSGSSTSVDHDIDKSKTSVDLATLRAEGFPAGKSQVTLAAYEIEEIEIDGEKFEQEVPMTGVSDMFRVVKLNGAYTLTRLRYEDEYVSLEGFGAEKETNADGEECYVYELALKDNGATRLNVSKLVTAKSGGAVKFYKSKSGREDSDASSEWSSFDLMMLSFNHGENMIYARVANEFGVRDYDLCIYGLFTLDVVRYKSEFTVSGGLRSYTNTRIGEDMKVVERDIIPADVMYDGVESGKLGRDDTYRIIEKTDIVLTAPGSSSTIRIYFYDDATVREDNAEYAEYAASFGISENDSFISLSSSGDQAGETVTVPAIALGKRVISASFFMSTVKKVYIAEGATDFVASFAYCNDVTDIYLPSTITHMRDFAFGGDPLNILPTALTVHCAFDSGRTSGFDVKWNYIAGKMQAFRTVYGETVPVEKNGISYRNIGGELAVTAVGSGFDGVIPSVVRVGGIDYDVTAIEHIDYGGKILIGNNVRSIAAGAFARAVSEIEVAADNDAFVVTDGVLYTADRSRIVVAERSLELLSVPQTVTAIDKYAFKGSGATLFIRSETDVYGDFDKSGLNAVFGVTALKTVENFEIAELSDGSVYLYGLTGSTDVETIVLPDSIGGKPVSEFACGVLAEYGSLKSVTIPFVGARRDGEGAAYFGCLFGAENRSVPQTLRSVVLTGGDTIASNAFYGLGTLTPIELTLPDSLQVVESSSALESVKAVEYCGGYYIGTADNPYYLLRSVYNETTAVHPDTMAIVNNIFFDYNVWNTNENLQTTEYGGATYLAIGDNPYGALMVIDSSATSIELHRDTRIFCANVNPEQRLAAITVPADNEYFSARGGVLYDKAETRIKHIPRMLGGNVEIAEGVSKITYDMLMYRTMSGLIIPSTVTNAKIPVSARALEYIEVADSNPVYASDCGILYDKALTEIVFVPNALGGDVVVPDTVTVIDASAFEGRRITSVTIGSGVKSIGMRAFYSCGMLGYVVIGGSVETIAEEAFRECGVLYDVAMGENVKTIGQDAFTFCTNLDELELPLGIQKLEGSWIFDRNNQIARIRFRGTKAQWANVDQNLRLDGYDDGTKGRVVIVCDDGEIS